MNNILNTPAKTIDQAAGYFRITSIEDIQILHQKIRNTFNNVLQIDSFALISRREEYPLTIHEQRGFYQVLDDYYKVNECLRRIKEINKKLISLKPLTIIVAIIIILLIIIAYFEKIHILNSIIPFFNTDATVWIFAVLLITFTILLYMTVSSKISGETLLSDIHNVLMEYENKDNSYNGKNKLLTIQTDNDLQSLKANVNSEINDSLSENVE